MIDRNTVVVGVSPRITADQFRRVLEAASSPALIESDQCYSAIVAENVDPAFCLACFAVESAFGNVGICHDYATRSPGNTRSTVTLEGQPVTTPQGIYMKYPSWKSGFKDMAFRLVFSDYVYARKGLKTISQILAVFAPASDGNAPNSYATSVVKLMNSWIGAGSMAPKPNITWVGSPNHYNGRSGQSIVAIVDHIMVGTMESTRGWFNNPASEVSSTFGVAKDGRIHQYVALENGAWANGITEAVDVSIDWLVNAVRTGVNPNNLTVSIEHEGSSGDVMPEAQYQASLALHRWLIDTYNIPVDRKHIIGHYQIMSRTKANCPGKGFPWARLMKDLASGGIDKVANNNEGSKPAIITMPTGKHLGGGFKDFYYRLAAAGPNLELLTLGYPVTDEFDCPFDGKVSTVQLFERSGLIYEAANQSPWDVHGMTLGQLEQALNEAKKKSLLN